MSDETERLRRWRLLLGAPAEPELGNGPLGGDDRAMDLALNALYDDDRDGPPEDRKRGAGLGGSAPKVARWLGDIRTYFPSSVVQVMQRDAMTRLNLRALLSQPELLAAVEPDVALVGTLISLNSTMPERTKETARQVVRGVVEDIERRIADRLQTAVTGALDRSARTRRPRPGDIDWNRTVRANLAHYQPEHRTVIPERLVGHARRRQAVERDVILAVDQSGSMASSVVHAAVLGSVLASIRSLRTHLIVFDTNVVDLTEHLADPVDVLFGTQLGGGTDINRAVAYCQTLVTRPRDTLFFLVSDLFEGGVRDDLLRRVAAMQNDGVTVVVLLALSDDGAPAYDDEIAAALAAIGAPTFATTPDAFPALLEVALTGGDVSAWAAREQAAKQTRT